MAGKLEGKRAIITGASRGIGLEIAKAYLREGAKVVISSRKKENLDSALAELGHAGSVHAIPCHASELDQLRKLIDDGTAWLGGLDILVNNAGTNPHFGPMFTATPEAFDKTVALNLRSYFFASIWAREKMENTGGSIICVASIAGLEATPMMGIYAVTKAGVIHMCRNMAREWGGNKIRVNAIAPGLVKTKLAAALWQNPDFSGFILDRQAIPGLMEPTDIAPTAVFLASDDSARITGRTMVVDSGVVL